MKKILATLAFGLAVLPLMSAAALAHGCHRNVEEGRRGWHRHVGRDCERIEAYTPQRRYREHHHEEYREGRRYDDRGPPQCVKKCQYIGPIKTCDTICR